MNASTRLLLFACVALMWAVPAHGQEPPPATDPPVEEELPPPGLAEAELERSRMCVPVVARLAVLQGEIEPLATRARRIAALNEAVGLEDRDRAAPLDQGDPLEESVARWFERDEELALALSERDDEALQTERNQARQEILERIREAFESVSGEAQRRLDAEGELAFASQACEGAILVRSAVLEACEETESPICTEARATAEEAGDFRFVEAPEDLWGMEQLRPWTNPTPLLPSPEGGLAGARTGTFLRRGNVSLVVSLQTIVQERSAMGEEEAAEFDAHIEALGIEFDHPRFVMSPALAFALDIPRPLAGETHYLLHFGDLSNPQEQVFWTVPSAMGGPIQELFPAPGWVLNGLAQGEVVRLTAVLLPEEEVGEAEAVYTLEFTSVGQVPAVTALLGYLAGGDFSADLARLVPPDGAGER